MVDSLLQQLQGDDTVLLMYLVGEFPAEDRAEVDRRIAADAKLRAALERLSEAQGTITAGLEALDAATPMDADVSAAVRRASTAIRRWQARPAKVVSYNAEHEPTRRWRVWLVPSAVAAVALIVVGIMLYANSAQPTTIVRRIPTPQPGVLQPAIPAPDEESKRVESLLAATTPTGTYSEFDAVAETVGPGMDLDAMRDERDSKTTHEAGSGDTAVFDVPLDSGQ